MPYDGSRFADRALENAIEIANSWIMIFFSTIPLLWAKVLYEHLFLSLDRHVLSSVQLGSLSWLSVNASLRALLELGATKSSFLATILRNGILIFFKLITVSDLLLLHVRLSDPHFIFDKQILFIAILCKFSVYFTYYRRAIVKPCLRCKEFCH